MLHHVCASPAAFAPPATIQPPSSAVVNIPDSQTFLLHSRPTATRVIYLDFHGRTISGTPWNTNYTKGADIVIPRYDVDGNPSAFSTKELQNIRAIWQRVAEDYAPFDVDVTTEDPGSESFKKTGAADLNYGVRVCVGGDGAWCGKPGGGGFLNTFAWTPSATYPNPEMPVFVFPDNLRYVDARGNVVEKGVPKFVADAAAHEAGHTFNLSHDGQTVNGTTKPYFSGQNNCGALM